MIKLASTIVSFTGMITTLNTEDSHVWEGTIPAINTNLLTSFNEATNKVFKHYFQSIINSTFPSEINILINTRSVQISGCVIGNEAIVLYWKTQITPNNELHTTKIIPTSFTKVDAINNTNLPIEVSTFKRLTDNLPLVIFEFNVYTDGTFKFGYVNKQMYTFFEGFNKEQVNNNNNLLFVNLHPDDRNNFQLAIKNVNNLSLINIEFRILENGTIKWIRGYWKKELTTINDGVSYCGYFKDITETKKIIEHLELFDFSIKNISVPVVYIKKDGSIYYSNDAYTKMYGVNDNGATTLKIFDFGNGFTKESFHQYWERVRLQGSFTYNSKRTKNDGTVIDVEITPNFIKFGDTELICSFVTDITEKKELEQSLKKEKTLLRTLIDNLPFPVFVKDTNGKKLITNKPDVEMLLQAKNAEDVIGKTDLELFSDNENHVGYIQDLQVLTTGTPVIEEQETFYHKNNRRIDVLTTKLPLFDAFGNIIGLIGFCRDISDKVKVEEKLKLVDFAFRNAAIPMQFIKEDGSVYDFNHAAATLMGYSEEEYKKLTVFELNKALTPTEFKRIWGILSPYTDMTYNYDLTKENKEIINVEIRVNKITYGELELMCSSFTDITEKKKTEQQLKMINFGLKNASIPMHFMTKDGLMYDFNHKACDLLGFTEEEYKNVTIEDISVRHSFDSWRSRWNDLKKGNDILRITKLRKKDLSLLDVEIRTDIFEYDNVELSCTSFIDITEKKKTEEQLKLIDYAFRNVSTAMFFMTKEGTFYDFNEATAKLLGYTPLELKDIKLFDINPNYNLELWSKRWKEIFEEKNTFRVSKLKRKDGSFIDVEVNTNVLKFGDIELTCAFYNDITERNRAEEALQKSNQRYEFATIATSDVIWDYDMAENSTYFSKNMTTQFGHPLNGIEFGTNNTWRRNLHPEDVERVVALENSAIEGAMEKWEIEYRFKKADNNYVTILDRGFAIRNVDGKVVRLVGAMQDISLRKESEKEKLNLINELIENNKELKQFSYITTHNLRAPLTNLISICNLLDIGNITDYRTKRLFDGIKHSTDQLYDTLNDLIEILIIKENKNIEKKELSFEKVFNQVKESVSTTIINSNATIKTNFLDAPTIKYSSIYLESILLNLLTNSIKYSTSNRPILIDIKTEKNEDGSIKLIFTDNGIGMDMHIVKDKIFGLYQRFHSNTDSKGLGLYLIHSQITALGGNIEVDSRVDVGTTFTIKF